MWLFNQGAQKGEAAGAKEGWICPLKEPSSRAFASSRPLQGVRVSGRTRVQGSSPFGPTWSSLQARTRDKVTPRSVFGTRTSPSGHVQPLSFLTGLLAGGQLWTQGSRARQRTTCSPGTDTMVMGSLEPSFSSLQSH